jgi:hypothetical protein
MVVVPGDHHGDLRGLARAHQRPRVADTGGVAHPHVVLDVLAADDGGQITHGISVPRNRPRAVAGTTCTPST